LLILQSSYELVKNWLLLSRLRDSDNSSLHYGGVHSYYDEKNKKFEFLYLEITGYYLSMMRFLYEHENKEVYLKDSEPSAVWLSKIYEKYGSIIQGFKNLR